MTRESSFSKVPCCDPRVNKQKANANLLTNTHRFTNKVNYDTPIKLYCFINKLPLEASGIHVSGYGASEQSSTDPHRARWEVC